MESAPELFSRNKDQETKQLETERDQLYRIGGQLQIEVGWSKKDRTRGRTDMGDIALRYQFNWPTDDFNNLYSGGVTYCKK